MAQYEVVVVRTTKYAILVDEAGTPQEARDLAVGLVREGNQMNFYDVLDAEVPVETGDGSLEATFREIASITGATLEQVDAWAKTIDEDRFVAEPIEELANEFADQL